MLIQCKTCEAKVDAKIVASHIESSDDYPFLFRASLLTCPACKSVMLAGQEIPDDGNTSWNEDAPTRLWPVPEKHIDSRLPELVRKSLEEAHRCYSGKVYIACAVMCGRILEAICSEFKTKNKFLAGGLKELLETGIIDKKIYNWGEALRRHRNIGAHVSSDVIEREDAKDLIEFADAICDYIFVLAAKFEEFMERIKKKQSKQNKPIAIK